VTDHSSSGGDLPELSRAELKRYLRHLTLPEVGEDGQRRLKAARVLVVGAGGLGSPASLYLAAAGIGRLGLVDFDAVDETNLQRQVLHGTRSIGIPKLQSARERLSDLNPHVEIETFENRLSSENALEILAGYDVVVDGSDNFPTRYLANDACVLSGKPYVYGAVFRFEGQASVFGAEGGPCYRCLFREPPPPGLVPSCAEAGILGVVPGIIGSIQALETVKLILSHGDSLSGRLVLFDALETRFRELRLRRDPDCPVCGEAPTLKELIDYEAFCGAIAAPAGELEISPVELAGRLEQSQPPLMVDVREPYEWKICSIPGSIHIPLSGLRERAAELGPDRDIVAICHHGIRSLLALEILKSEGFTDVKSLHGGVETWALEVDPEMERY
jgi:adenylyltransferase/sulfurtransferase